MTSIPILIFRLQIIPNLFERNLTTSGAVAISFNALESTNVIVLHAYQLDIEKDSVKLTNLNDSFQIQITDQSYSESEQKYTITLIEYLEQNKHYELQIKFTGIINDKMQGFYKSQYLDRSRNLTQ